MAILDLESLGKQIGVSCAAGATDMNVCIAKTASEKNLNREQTRRLIEEANKGYFLESFRLTGQQCFDVASYDKVASLLTPEEPILNKCASEHVSQGIVRDTNVFGSPYHREMALLKTAETNLRKDIDAIDRELSDMTQKFDGWIRKLASEDGTIGRMSYDNALGHLAKTDAKAADALTAVYNHINKLYSDRATLEKAAAEGARYTLAQRLQDMRAEIKRKVESKTPHHMGNAPIPMRHGIAHAGRVIGEDGAYVKVAMSPPVSEFAFDQLPKILKNKFIESAPKLALVGSTIGTGYAIKKLKDTHKKRKEKMELERNFDFVMQKDPSLAQDPNTRSYFDTISNFSPMLAKDPNTLQQLLNQFKTFDGVDINTVKVMREIEKGVPLSESKIPGVELLKQIT